MAIRNRVEEHMLPKGASVTVKELSHISKKNCSDFFLMTFETSDVD